MQSSLASQYLSNELTVFAPSDGAMAKYTGPKDDQFIMNHMGKNLIFTWLVFYPLDSQNTKKNKN